MQKILLITLFGLSSLFAKAQQVSDSVKLFIPEIDSVCSNNFIYVPVKSINFRNVVGFQGTIKWDSTILKLDSIFINNNVPYFDSLRVDSNFNLKQSFIAFTWVNAINNLTLSDSTTLFRLRYKILKSSQISSSIYFDNLPTPTGVDTAADLVNLSDLATLSDNVFINGKINFVDTPTVVQNGNVFTAIASCNPQYYFWYTYDCNGNLLSIDSTTTNSFTSPYPSSTCYSMQVTCRYGNGNSIKSSVTPNILPLTLTALSAKLQATNNVLLNWHTANEINVSHFNVQRSLNGKDFTTIGKVKAENKSSNEYSFTDDKQQITFYTKLYYRIEGVDNDGKKTYSEIRNLELGMKNGVSIYPNPAKNIVNIECVNAKEILVVDYLGKTIYKSTVNSQWSIVNTKQFAKGLYMVLIKTINGETISSKLLVE